MKLTRKLTVAFVLAVAAVFSLNAVIRVEREGHLFENDIRRDARQMGRALGAAVFQVWGTAGEASAFDLVRHANESESGTLIRWVWFDGNMPQEHAPSLPRALLQAAVAGPELTIRTREDGKDADAIYTYVPVSVPGGREGALELRESLEEEAQYIQRTIQTIMLTTAALVMLFAALALGLGAVMVGRPIQQLVEKARRIGAGDFSGELHFTQNDEIGALAAEINMMCHELEQAHVRAAAETQMRIAALSQLRHADRLTTVGRLASGIAHELGTPLNVVSGRAELLREALPNDPAVADATVAIIEYTRRMAATIRQLLDFARQSPAQKRSTDLRGIVQQTADMLRPLASKHRVDLLVRVPAEPVRVFMDGAQLQQALSNIIVNGVQSMAAGGTMTLEAGQRVVSAPPTGAVQSGYAVLRATDTGSGMPAHVVERIFEPFFTTKDVGQGTGLGLSVTHGIVDEHHGWIEVKSTEGQGSTFEIFLPVVEAK